MYIYRHTTIPSNVYIHTLPGKEYALNIHTYRAYLYNQLLLESVCLLNFLDI